jgi:hypothetical protein
MFLEEKVKVVNFQKNYCLLTIFQSIRLAAKFGKVMAYEQTSLRGCGLLQHDMLKHSVSFSDFRIIFVKFRFLFEDFKKWLLYEKRIQLEQLQSL